jgi:hypothetical protein
MFPLRCLAIAALTLSLNIAAAEHKTLAQKQAEAELLALHQQDRRAHLTRDVDLLLQHSGPELIDVRDGNVAVLSRDTLSARFTDYFHRATFSAWEDVVPPIVRASEDGSMGWMIVRVHIAYIELGPSGPPLKHDETMAWMSTYRKSSGKWIHTAVTSTTEK